MATALTTVDAVKEFLGKTDSGDDALLDRIVTGVSNQIEDAIGRVIIPKKFTSERVSSAGYSHLTLRHWPAIEVTEVRDINGTVVTASDYVVDLDAGQIHTALGGSWTKGIRNYQVDYTAGYQTVPAALELAATEEAAHRFKRSSPGGGRVGLRSESSEIGNTTAYESGGFLPSTEQTIRQFSGVL